MLPLLRIGDAVAFHLTGVGDDRAARDAAARAVLTAHAGQPVTVHRRPSGRPALMPPWPELGVSLAHSGAALLAGFNPHGAAGVDCELADVALDHCALARDHFSPAEAQAVAAGHNSDLFLRLWTAKEAVLKATGRGIADGLLWPDLSQSIPALQRDGAIIPIAASARAPAAQVAVCIVPGAGRRLYAALAILA